MLVRKVLEGLFYVSPSTWLHEIKYEKVQPGDLWQVFIYLFSQKTSMHGLAYKAFK